MDPILELRDLVKEYPGQRAVDSVSLTIPRGGFFSLLGPSGCGKTTTLRMIAGFEQPTSGEVRLSGAVVNGRRPYERNVSTVFQSYALFPHLTAQENIEFGLRRQRGSSWTRFRQPPPSPGTPARRPAAEQEVRPTDDGIAKKVAVVLDLVRLAGKEKRRPSELSGGERQRVALARSLVIEPDVLLLDEPLAALDPKLRKQMRIELKELQRRVGITFLLVTHDQEEALSMSDQLAVMNAGRVEQVGTPEDIYLRPRTRFVAGFLGAVNWIGEAGLRPEVIRISRPGNRTAACWRPAVVTGSVFLGNCVHVMARLETGEEAVAEVPRDHASFQKGDTVEICWHERDEMRFE